MIRSESRSALTVLNLQVQENLEAFPAFGDQNRSMLMGVVALMNVQYESYP